MHSDKDYPEWVTVQDCIGAPGFASTPANVRKKLDLLASHKPALKRKRMGSKAFEYHKSLLPRQTQAFMGGVPIEPAITPETPERLPDLIEDSGVGLKSWWDVIFHSLENEELERIAYEFKLHGKAGIFQEPLLSLPELHLSQASINTAKMIESLAPETRKEILAQFGLEEQAGPVAPHQEDKEPHKKTG